MFKIKVSIARVNKEKMPFLPQGCFQNDLLIKASILKLLDLYNTWYTVVLKVQECLIRIKNEKENIEIVKQSSLFKLYKYSKTYKNKQKISFLKANSMR